MKKSFLLLAVASMMAVFASCEKPEPDPEGPTTVANAFSVAAGKQVLLAPGNLQHRPSVNAWRFAPNAWDACMEDNVMASPEFDDWIDNFGWATSGHEGYLGSLASSANSNYYHGGSINGTEYDWGQHNAIQNGGATDPAGTWRTLTQEEWEYLINQREASTVAGTANARYLFCTVHGQTGLLLFPDQFEYPEGLQGINPSHINTPDQYSNYLYSQTDWERLKEAGCAFLPAAGCRLVLGNNPSMISMDFLGAYWTATYAGTGDPGYMANQLAFSPSICEIGTVGIQFGRCVRLAKDVK